MSFKLQIMQLKEEISNAKAMISLDILVDWLYFQLSKLEETI
jgi:hypothetical protein